MPLTFWSGLPKTTQNSEMHFYALLKRNEAAATGPTELGK
jgi:hypothetical protein